MTRTDRIATHIIEVIADEWIKQGHDMTGEAIKRMYHTVEEQGAETVITIWDGTETGYMAKLDKGVKPQDIVTDIIGLIRFFKHPLRGGLSDEEAVRAAFATNEVHKREGMPTEASKVHSQTGKRIGFVEDGTKDVMIVVEQIMAEAFEEAIA